MSLCLQGETRWKGGYGNDIGKRMSEGIRFAIEPPAKRTVFIPVRITLVIKQGSLGVKELKQDMFIGMEQLK